MTLFRQIPLFLGVGGLATAAHVLVALLVEALFSPGALTANFCGYAAAVLLSYLGHTRWTFALDTVHGFHFPRFLAVSLTGLALSSLVTWLGVEQLGLGFALTMMLVAVAVPAFTFVMLRFWAFDTKRQSATVETHTSLSIGLGLSVLAALVAYAVFQGRMINHDTAWYLAATERWLAGAQLYRDLIEVNPPINFYYTAPALWISDLTGTSLQNGQYALMAVLTGLMLAWCWVLLVKSDLLTPRRRIAFLAGLWVAVTMPALPHFAQREHTLVLLLLPWAVGLMVRTDGDRDNGAILRAGVAALGVCLKPYFVIYPICTTLALVLQRRSLRPILSPANLTFLVVGLAYVAFVWTVHRAYFTDILPLALRVYGDIGYPFRFVVDHLGLTRMAAIGVLALMAWRAGLLTRPVVLSLSLIVAALVSYFVQSTGFFYQSLPVHSFALVMVFLLLLDARADRLIAGAAALCLAVYAGAYAQKGTYTAPLAADLLPALRQIEQPGGLVIYSSHVSLGASLALETGRSWTSSYPTLWTVPAIANAGAESACRATEAICADLRREADAARTGVLRDLQRDPPAIIVFDKNPGYFRQPGFSYEAFLRTSPQIATIFDGYGKRVSIGRFDILLME